MNSTVNDGQNADLDSLISQLVAIRLRVGKNLPINVSVLEETPKNAFGTFYDDRTLSNHVEIVKHVDGDKFVELYV